VGIELAEVVAGFPLVLSFAMAGGINALREGRRRTSLNEAVHELRRPLQALALSLPEGAEASAAVDSSLRMAAAAVDRLDREINGGWDSGELTPVAPRRVVEAAVARWRARAEIAGRPLRLSWSASDPLLRGEPVELGQAVDNMISNAFEHGGGEVAVEVGEGEGSLLLAVLDDGRSAPSSRRRGIVGRAGIGGRGRHGHGLRVVRRAAARHGGRFRLRRTSRGTEARLELPMAGGAG